MDLKTILAAGETALQTATQAQLNTLGKFLPICASLSDAQLETYLEGQLSRHSHAAGRKKRSVYHLEQYQDEAGGDDGMYYNTEKRNPDSDITKILDNAAKILSRLNQKKLATLAEQIQKSGKGGNGDAAAKQLFARLVDATPDCAKLKAKQRQFQLQAYQDDYGENEYK